MPKNTLPLGSAAAHGKFGNVVVFTGVTSRSYVKPRDPRSEEQMSVRHLFADVCKELRMLGTLGRGFMTQAWGVRWFSHFYKLYKQDNGGVLAGLAATYAGFTSFQKAIWFAYAPHQGTYDDAGKMFFLVASFARSVAVAAGYGTWGIPEPGASNAGLVAVWWEYAISKALTVGLTEAGESKIVKTGGSQTAASNAHGGYQWLDFTAVEFWFVGTVAQVMYHQISSGGILSIVQDGNAPLTLDQTGTNTWQKTYNLATLAAGLHHVLITKTGGTAANLDAITVS
jgi:hypothetical protein